MPLWKSHVWKVALLALLVTLSPCYLVTLSSAQEPTSGLSLPQPPNWPRSLYAPPVPLAISAPLVPEEPYFLKDPLLDRPELPPPGWFGLAWADVVHPRLVNHLRAVFTDPSGVPHIAQTAAAPLDWTVAPALSVGYRFPAGFGEVSFLWRGLASSGSALIDGNQTHSRIDFNVMELNYANWELWPCPGWIFRPQLGLRLVYDYFDTVADAVHPLVGSTAQLKTTNCNREIGPHAGLLIGRYVHESDLAVVGQIDLGTLFGATSQGFLQESVLNAAGDRLDQSFFNGFAAWTAMLNAQAGVLWSPADCRGLNLFVGYSYEAWWSVGQIGLSNGAFLIQGVALRGMFPF